MSTYLLLEGPRERLHSLGDVDPGVKRDKTTSVGLRALQAGVILAGACCRAPYYAMNRDVIDDTEASAIWLDVASTIAFAVMYIWSGFGIAKAITAPGAESIGSTRCQVVLNNRVVKLTIAVAGAVFSLVEGMYFANKYNGKNGPIMVAVVLGVLSWMPMYSIMKGLDKLADRVGAEKQDLFQALDEMQGAMDRMISNFISSLDDTEKAAIVMSQVERLKDQPIVERIQAVARLIFQKVDAKGKDNLLVKSAGGVGWGLYGMMLSYFGFFGYEGAKVVYDKEEWAVFIAVVSVLANMYLFGEVIPQSMKALAHEVQGDRKQSLNAQISPVKSAMFRAASILFPAFSFGAIVKGCRDEFEYEVLSLFMQITVATAAAVFLKMVMDMASEDALREINKRDCTEDQRALLEVVDKARDLQDKVKYASYADLVEMYKELPDDVQGILGELVEGDLATLISESGFA